MGLRRVRRPLQEAFDIGGEQRVRRAFRPAHGDLALQPRGQLLPLPRRDGAHLAIGRAGGQLDPAIRQHALLRPAIVGFVR